VTRKLSVIDNSARVRLELESRPESVALVRAVLTAFSDELGLEDELADDLRTAVSEACNNVVLHAYQDSIGPLAVSVAANQRRVEALIEDRGLGIRTVSVSDHRMGVGLAVITALAASVHIESDPDAGTTVRMSFDLPGDDADDCDEALDPLTLAPAFAMSGSVVAWIAPVALIPSVLGRLTRAIAATQHFTLDGAAAVAEVTSAIGDYAALASLEETIGFAATTATRRIELLVGPFRRADDFDSEQASELADRRRRIESADPVEEVVTVDGPGSALMQVVIADHSRDAGA
jgi:anti-sigma regulatory factor (Ser/Thr protein kinase)